MTQIIICPCCGQCKPDYDFPAGKTVCTVCSQLDGDRATILARETMRREIGAKTQTAIGRKQARIAAKFERYEKEGKRCASCHHKKTPEHFDKCAPTPDGLQPNCRVCNKLWRETVRDFGTPMWHQVRDALRKASPEGK